MSRRTQFILTPEILLRAYAGGIFPMADSATSTEELRWFDPPIRAIIPLDERFHLPQRLKRTIRQRPYDIRLDTAFEATMRGCAAPRPDHPDTWINEEILRLYTDLHRMGHAHSIEAWDGDELVGGLYGVSLGRAFFGESMFSRKTDSSKIALVHLVALMRHCGFTLLDTQFQTEHLVRFGTAEITRANYHHLLEDAIAEPAVLALPPGNDAWHHLAVEVGTGGGVTADADPLQPTSHKS